MLSVTANRFFFPAFLSTFVLLQVNLHTFWPVVDARANTVTFRLKFDFVHVTANVSSFYWSDSFENYFLFMTFFQEMPHLSTCLSEHQKDSFPSLSVSHSTASTSVLWTIPFCNWIQFLTTPKVWPSVNLNFQWALFLNWNSCVLSLATLCEFRCLCVFMNVVSVCLATCSYLSLPSTLARSTNSSPPTKCTDFNKFIQFRCSHCYLADQITSNEVDGACVTYGGEIHKDFWWRNSREIDHLWDLDVDVRKILKWEFNNYDVAQDIDKWRSRVNAGSIWRRNFLTGYGTVSFWTTLLGHHHPVVCLTTGSKPLPKLSLHILPFTASSFKWEYPLLSLRSSGSFLRLLPCLLVTSISNTVS